MGRHSRGSSEAPAPLPDPPTRHPYAARSTEDTGDWDRRGYRVVDVGLPPGTPGAPAPAEPFRYGGEPRRGHGATRAEPDPHQAAPQTRPDDLRARSAPDPAAFGGSRLGSSDPGESRFGGAPVEPRFGGGRPDVGGPQFGSTRADLAGTRFGESQPDGGAPRFGGSRPDTDPRFRGPATGPAESRFGGEPRFGATRADLAESRFGGPRFGLGESRLAAPVDPGLAPVRADPAESRFGATRVDLAAPRPGRESDPGEPRFGATRADLAASVGSAALAPRPAPDPDEVTDTGARRARSAFRLATEDDEEEHDEEEHDEPEREPALILQWGIFVAQTLTGAIAGLGIWLGFYRLWSTWPFYAVPAVGVAAIGMLVLARALRRRHGRDLDLLTAVVTAGVSTVLTVLPAAFTLHGLTQ